VHVGNTNRWLANQELKLLPPPINLWQRFILTWLEPPAGCRNHCPITRTAQHGRSDYRGGVEHLRGRDVHPLTARHDFIASRHVRGVPLRSPRSALGQCEDFLFGRVENHFEKAILSRARPGEKADQQNRAHLARVIKFLARKIK